MLCIFNELQEKTNGVGVLACYISFLQVISHLRLIKCSMLSKTLS